MLPEIVFLTSYPPQQCGIATFSQDLVLAMNNRFDRSFRLTIALLKTEEQIIIPQEVEHVLDTAEPQSYRKLTKVLNRNPAAELIVVQHEFGFYYQHETDFILMLIGFTKPVVMIFHTVLPKPNDDLRQHVIDICENCAGIVVMTESSAQILIDDYAISPDNITVIPHGTHLVHHRDQNALKEKYGFSGKKILSTFGLISSGKSIETTLLALPAIIQEYPDVLFLIIGKTHPGILKREGEHYRNLLSDMVLQMGIGDHVKFVNSYLPLPVLLEYLQLTDLYLFTSRDPNQAVSGTFSYALSCGCPIISTPIPHAVEVLQDDPKMIVPFGDHDQLAASVCCFLSEPELRNEIKSKYLHRMATTAWENVALQYSLLFHKVTEALPAFVYRVPPVNLYHAREMTTDFGMIQFSQLNEPDIDSGYTLDDNARAMIALCQHYSLTKDEADLKLIDVYLTFIGFCFRPDGYFLNYVDEKKAFTAQNYTTNLSDSNGRAIWALGYLTSFKNILPETMINKASALLKGSLLRIPKVHSTRAMSFVIKGLCYYHSAHPNNDARSLIVLLSDRLVQMYKHESDEGWEWFESYLTYANSLIPDALLSAYEITDNTVYRDIAVSSFDFLLSRTFLDYGIRVVSNRGWMKRGETYEHFCEQPIDIAYTVITLSRFYQSFKEDHYLIRMQIAFNWFLGRNHLNRIIYNPCTGGCWDGLERDHVNLNQGAESTVSYLMARLILEVHKEDLRRIYPSLQQQEEQERILMDAHTNSRVKELNMTTLEITDHIMVAYPELYRSLSETPFSETENNRIGDLEEYLGFLQRQLLEYEETHTPQDVLR